MQEEIKNYISRGLSSDGAEQQKSIQSELEDRHRKLEQEFAKVAKALLIIAKGKEVTALETLELGSILSSLNIRPR